MEVKLTLVTKRNPMKVKGLDSTVGAIVDADNHLVCIVPLTRMDWVFDCLTAKTKTDRLFEVLSKMTDDEVHLCNPYIQRGKSRPVATGERFTNAQHRTQK